MPLTFAVVAHAAGFQNRWEANFLNSGIESVTARNRLELRRGNSQFLEKSFLADSVLGNFQSFRGWQNWGALCEESNRFHRDVFEFVGDEFKAVREFFQRRFVAKIRGNTRSDATDWRFRRRIEETKMQPERIARESQHIAQLPATQDSD